MRRNNTGFTLVELAIVLVIIGLIIGGILVGRDLIAAAELRASITQFDKIRAAVYTFRTRYHCLPGDCNNAIALGVGTQNGDRNGLIDGLRFPSGADGGQIGVLRNPPAFPQNGGYTEVSDAIEQLYNAGLINQGRLVTAADDTAAARCWDGLFPVLPNQVGCLFVASYMGKLHLRTSSFQTISSQVSINGYSFTPGEAKSIDTKIDDGSPYGRARSAGGGDGAANYNSFNGTPFLLSLAPANACIDDSGASWIYHITNTARICEFIMPL